MSDTDLRPAPGPGFRPEPSGAKWWEPLTSKWALLSVLIVLGYFIGVVAFTLTSKPRPSEQQMRVPTEVNRPILLAELRPAIDAFYANPNEATQDVAMKAITDYRRSFADALPETLQAPSEKIACAVQAECNLKMEQQREEDNKLEWAILKTIASLPKRSVEYRASLAEALTLQRRFDVTRAIRVLAEDRGYYESEKQATAILADLAHALDQHAHAKNRNTGNRPKIEPIFSEYFQKYSAVVERTAQPFRFFQNCPQSGETETGDVARCRSAVAEYEAAIKQHNEKATAEIRRTGIFNSEVQIEATIQVKAIALKKLLAERAAPKKYVEDRLSEILR